ncbi:trace amine-associated receptor 7e [Exaiptasia diaphana]|uniref:G-protein coupled receptors family 1 profile domain-containing protein n=1 Tax=Exaiptasia diaphana TaxID=2652724 RepID=A0A913XHZ6_EXADI|nr:trace amine-associated receptor 7e [Exaiptasia diaphana]
MANNSSSVMIPTTTIPDVCFLSVPEFDPHNMNRPDSVHPTWTFLATVNGLAALPTIVVNALVIWAVVGNENLRSSAFNLVLASLAVTDLLTGLLVEPMYCLFLGCLVNTCLIPDCTFTAYLLSVYVCAGMTIVSFSIASVERYLAIEHPNFYLQNITGKKLGITTVISWIITVGFLFSIGSLLNQSNPNLSKVPAAIVAGILGVITLFCSTKVQMTAYRQSRTIALQQESVQQPDEQQQQEQRLQEYKRVFTMSMLVVLSILFYSPFIIITVIDALDGKDVTSDFGYISAPISITFIHLQSLINPIIMSLRLSYIRQGIKNKVHSLVQGTD